MASDKMTISEIDFVQDAIWDVEQFGKTDKKCPKCGGDILIKVAGNSSKAECENGCFCIVNRGL